MDPLADWLEDSGIEMENVWTPFKALFGNYQKWCKEFSVNNPLSRKGFAQRLNERFIPQPKGKIGTKDIPGWTFSVVPSLRRTFSKSPPRLAL